jgi:hypothetical protein
MERFIRSSLLLGAIAGAISGILLLVPFVAPFVFLLLFIVPGVVVIVLLKRSNTVGLLTPQDGAFIGALAGFSSLVAGSVLYIPGAFIIYQIVGLHSNSFNISHSFSLIGYNVLAISMLVFFTAALSALINAFSGMVAAYIYERIDKKDLNFEDHLDLEKVDQIIE